jgi:flagellar protein FliO/FliZ
MQFISSLIGGSDWLSVVFALGAVLVAIVLVVWLLKLVFNASGNVGRGRNRRLSVVDSLALDPKRQLLIIRRDEVEHLILVGGPHDLVVEAGIPVAPAQTAQPARRPVGGMVGSRRPAPAPAATPDAPAAAPATAIEQLRQMGAPTDRKAHLSLRHTGLLRPVQDGSVPESAENSVSGPLRQSDSAKEVGTQQPESTTIAGNNEANRV